jgi:hypothetical protein
MWDEPRNVLLKLINMTVAIHIEETEDQIRKSETELTIINNCNVERVIPKKISKFRSIEDTK